MTRRGDGIGLEVTTSVVRGVRLDQDEPGRVVAAAEAPISRFDDEAAVLDALVRVHGQLGDMAGIHAATTRAAWFPVGSTMQRLDATGQHRPRAQHHAPRPRRASRHHIDDADRGAGSAMDARVAMGSRRGESPGAAARARRFRRRVGRTGAGRVWPCGRRMTPVARRDASNGHSWAAVFEAGVPIAATSVPQASREYPGMAIAADVDALHRLDDVLGAPELADLVDEIAATAIASTGKSGELHLQLVLADDPYPPFPAHDLRAPQRQAVALGAAAGAAGLAGRLRPVDVLSPTGAPRAADTRRPWAIERIVELPPRVRARRRPWWRRHRTLRSVAVEETGSFAEDGDRLAQRHQVAALTTFGIGAGVRRPSTAPARARTAGGCSRPRAPSPA